MSVFWLYHSGTERFKQTARFLFFLFFFTLPIFDEDCHNIFKRNDSRRGDMVLF